MKAILNLITGIGFLVTTIITIILQSTNSISVALFSAASTMNLFIWIMLNWPKFFIEELTQASNENHPMQTEEK
jgi:hypothetical protein